MIFWAIFFFTCLSRFINCHNPESHLRNKYNNCMSKAAFLKNGPTRPLFSFSLVSTTILQKNLYNFSGIRTLIVCVKSRWPLDHHHGLMLNLFRNVCCRVPKNAERDWCCCNECISINSNWNWHTSEKFVQQTILDVGSATVAQWIRLRLPPCCPGFESQAHHLHLSI